MSRTILITGATDGIGLCLTRLYRARGWRLVLVGRRPLSALDDDLFDAWVYCRADLADPGCVEEIGAWLDARGIDGLDVLVNNAATGYIGPIPGQSGADICRMVAVNLEAPIALTHTLLPRLRRCGGKVVFISSVVSQLPGPDYAVYGATKAALDGFARSLRVEMAGGVPVQVIHPGPTRTDMMRKSGGQMDTSVFADPDQVARRIAGAISGRRDQVTIGGVNRLVRWGGRWLGSGIEWGMARARKRTGPNGRKPRGRDGGDPPPGRRPRALITGAADGIGRALAARLAAEGWAILGLDVDDGRAVRTRQALRDAGAEADFLHVDLGDPAGIEEVVVSLGAGPPFELLVHNAGINAVGRFGELSLDAQRAVIAVNLVGPMVLTGALLRRELLAPGSSVVAVSSLSHFAGYPGAASYAASKDGLAAYARSLRVALADRDIHVLTVFPGPTRTAHARRYSPDNSREAQRMPSAELADHMVGAIRRRRRVLIPGGVNRLSALAGRLAPGLVEGVMRRSIYAKL